MTSNLQRCAAQPGGRRCGSQSLDGRAHHEHRQARLDPLAALESFENGICASLTATTVAFVGRFSGANCSYCARRPRLGLPPYATHAEGSDWIKGFAIEDRVNGISTNTIAVDDIGGGCGTDGSDEAMRMPRSVRGAEELGRVRLSNTFFMRDFLYSEIANVQRISNLPHDPDLAVKAGRALCIHLLEPLQATFGRLAIRSAYRSPEVNEFGNAHYRSCASNEANRARHIWDQRSADGGMGAMSTIVVPWLVDRMVSGTPWQAMAWWIHDHLPYSELQFFPKLGAFNIGWHEHPKRRISSFAPPRGLLTKPGLPNHAGDHSNLYPGFPALVEPQASTAAETS